MRRAAPILAVLALARGAAADSLTEYRARVLDPALHTYRYFPLTETSGTTAFDRSPNAVNGAYAGGTPVIADGPFYNVPSGGNAPQFAGDGRYMTAAIPDFADAVNGPDGATVVAWFRTPESAPGSIVGLCEDAGFSNGLDLSVGKDQFFPIAHPEKVTFAIVNDLSAFRSAAAAFPTFDDGDWHMIAASFRLGIVTIHFDAFSETVAYSDRQPRGPLNPFAGPMCVGAALQNDTQIGLTPFLGAVAHVSLHATALTYEQILSLWQAGNGYEPVAVFGADAIRPWFDAAAGQRVDAMILGDSNLVFGTDGGKYGHQFGMAQGLRRVFPIYASAVIPGIGTGAWSDPTNGIGPLASDVLARTTDLPPHIGPAAPPFTAGFPTAVAYAAAGVVIQSDSNWVSGIEWESPDILLDFTADLRFHFQYATFAGGAGDFHPRVRLFFPPYTAIAEKTLQAAPLTDALVEDFFDIPAGPRACGVPYAFQVTDIGGSLSAHGPFALLYARFVLPAVNAGAAMTPAWSVGGVGARAAADAFWNQATLPQLGAYLRQVVRHQPAGAERLLFQIIEGQNDINDWAPAIDGDGALTTAYSNTLRGQKLNTLAIMARVRDAWIAQGFEPGRLCFLLGPYHPSDRSETLKSRIPYIYLRGWKELAIEHPEYNIAAVNAYAFTSSAEFEANSWYFAPADQAHLNRSGYLNFGIKTWQALREAIAALKLGACCFHDGSCVVHSGDSCITAGGVFLGGGALCAPGLCTLPLSPCCYADGTCVSEAPDECAASGGSIQDACAACETHPCPQPSRACCFADASCQALVPEACSGGGGTPHPAGTPCSPNLCWNIAIGACCRFASCSIELQTQCLGPATRFAGGQTACNAPGVHTAPCCHADFNQSGQTSLQDVFEFLNAWFAQAPTADWDQSGLTPTLQDLFLFLGAWFTRC